MSRSRTSRRSRRSRRNLHKPRSRRRSSPSARLFHRVPLFLQRVKLCHSVNKRILAHFRYTFSVCSTTERIRHVPFIPPTKRHIRTLVQALVPGRPLAVAALDILGQPSIVLVRYGAVATPAPPICTGTVMTIHTAPGATRQPPAVHVSLVHSRKDRIRGCYNAAATIVAVFLVAERGTERVDVFPCILDGRQTCRPSRRVFEDSYMLDVSALQPYFALTSLFHHGHLCNRTKSCLSTVESTGGPLKVHFIQCTPAGLRTTLRRCEEHHQGKDAEHSPGPRASPTPALLE